MTQSRRAHDGITERTGVTVLNHDTVRVHYRITDPPTIIRADVTISRRGVVLDVQSDRHDPGFMPADMFEDLANRTRAYLEAVRLADSVGDWLRHGKSRRAAA